MKITDKYIFFWKEWVSNWHKNPVRYKGFTYPTSEHVFMVKKAELFGDDETIKLLQQTNSPREAQKIGREVKNFDQKIWDVWKLWIMQAANVRRFLCNPDLAKKLVELSTNNQTFVEASPMDCVWGIAMDENNENIENESYWQGQNLLGRVFTEIVGDLKKYPNAIRNWTDQELDDIDTVHVLIGLKF